MTLEQIISLTQAGFTKDDIFAMIDSNTNSHQPTFAPQPPVAAPAVPAFAPAPAPVPAPALAQVPAPVMGTAQMPASAPVYVPQQVPAPTPTPTPTPTPASASAWGFAPAPVPEQTQVFQQVPAWGAQGVVQPMSENDKMMNRLMESMNSLNNTMQKSNLMADVQPKAATTEDMLAAIINPPDMSN